MWFQLRLIWRVYNYKWSDGTRSTVLLCPLHLCYAAKALHTTWFILIMITLQAIVYEYDEP